MERTITGYTRIYIIVGLVGSIDTLWVKRLVAIVATKETIQVSGVVRCASKTEVSHIFEDFLGAGCHKR